ncbi:hypothetical protein [Oligoflexus tunisiensis]|uniref:hypothetical protein n=1 Tax=Oligoflexus tunisiensis TaxID=708132 RepID=UPI00114CC4F6|nr:hypothetical protein [Oligoflexus tunisiensis]
MMHQVPLKQRWTLPRSNLHLFAFRPDWPGRWVQLPLQLDPLDEEGGLLFPEDKDWMKKPIVPFDRLTFFTKQFGPKFDGKGAGPCQSTNVVELDAPGGFAYLASCPEAFVPKDFTDPVTLQEKDRMVTAKYYRYHYSERNHLVFDAIHLADPAFQTFHPVASQSDLLIVGDVKNFFTLHFDSEDIDAFISSKRSGDMGLMGGLKFYLRILYFKIKMSLMPEVNFFDDSVFMPMILTLPVNAKKYLRRGSGIYYTWLGDKDTEWLWDASELENLDLQVLNPDFEGSARMPSEKYCDRSKCRYKILGRNHGRLFALHFEISRKAAELGFFPRLIRDMPAVEKMIKHPVSRYPAQNRIGVYFETAQMPEGEHTWDFWIHFPEQEKDNCKVNVRARFLARAPSSMEKK